MLKFISELTTFIRQWLAVVGLTWGDARVPVGARLIVIMAPCYFLCPYDLSWDFSPGGYVDDLWIATLLVATAWRLIPRAVFADARRAAAIGAIGLVLGVSVSQPAVRSLDSITSRPALRQHTGPSTAAIACRSVDSNPHRLAVKRLCQPHLRKLAIADAEAIASIKQTDAPVAISLLLSARGGNLQLYGSAADPRPLFTRSLHTHLMPPPQSRGGYLFASLDKILIAPGDPC